MNEPVAVPDAIQIVSAPDVPDYWGIVEEGPGYGRCISVPLFWGEKEARDECADLQASAPEGVTFRVARMGGR